jgi:plastocyanin
VKPNHKEIQPISAPRADYLKPITKGVSVFMSFLRHLKTTTLALVMFVTQALVSATHGNDSEVRESATRKATEKEVVAEKSGFLPMALTVPAGASVTWTNHDSVPHVVMSYESPLQKSSGLKTEQGFVNSFVTAGTNSSKEASVIITPSFIKNQ